jgi:hypothetical protein
LRSARRSSPAATLERVIMKPKEIFQLAVRLLGLCFIYHGLIAVPGALSEITGAFPFEIAPGVTQSMSFGRFVMGALMVAWPLLVGWWLIKGAPLIMRIAYPSDAADSNK